MWTFGDVAQALAYPQQGNAIYIAWDTLPSLLKMHSFQDALTKDHYTVIHTHTCRDLCSA